MCSFIASSLLLLLRLREINHFLKLRGRVHHLDKDPLVLQRAATDFTKLDETLQEEAESLFQLVDTVLPFAKTKGFPFFLESGKHDPDLSNNFGCRTHK